MTTHWRDIVVSFSGDGGERNGENCAVHNLPDVPTGAIPHLLKTGRRKPCRSDERRVFAVGRETVKSWGGERFASRGVSQSRLRAEIRPRRARARIKPCGEHGIARATVFHWDVGYGCLRRVVLHAAAGEHDACGAVSDRRARYGGCRDAARAPMEAAGASTGTGDFDETFPATLVMLTASAYLAQDNEYNRYVARGHRCQMDVGWNVVAHDRRVSARELLAIMYSGTESATVTQSGKSVVYSASNSKIWDARRSIRSQRTDRFRWMAPTMSIRLHVGHHGCVS